MGAANSRSDLPLDSTHVVIAYIAADDSLVNEIKQSVKQHAPDVIVEWENLHLYEKGELDERQCASYIRDRIASAALNIFVVSKSWKGKSLIFDLDKTAGTHKYKRKLLPILVNWSLVEAQAEAARCSGVPSLLNTLLELRIVDADAPSSWAQLIAKVTRAICQGPPAAVVSAPLTWIDRADDLHKIAEGLGLQEGFRPPGLHKPGRVLCVNGPSGVGKSALTCRLMDLIRPYYTSTRAVRVEVGHSAEMRTIQQAILRGLGVAYEEGDNLQSRLVYALSTPGYFLILDDVWGWRTGQHSQLEILFGPNWHDVLTKETGNIGLGSCVLLSSQENLLRVKGSLVTIGSFEATLAGQLFCKLCFAPDGAPTDSLPWEEISEACEGLPLALEVTARSLSGQDRRVWQSTREALEHTKDVRARLLISYNLMPSEVQQTFVDIANFWKGQPWALAKAAVDSSAWEFLVNRNIIGEKYSLLHMHDLLERVGKDVAEVDGSWITSSSPENVEHHRPRGLRLVEEVLDDYQKGLDDLRILLIRDSSGELNLKPCQKLLYFDWFGAPSQKDVSPNDWIVHVSLPERSVLQTLRLRHCSGLAVLPEGISGLQSLRVLDLSGCSGLTKLPEDISGLGSLVELELSWCSGLTALPEGLSGLANLEKLNLHACWGLMKLPPWIRRLSGLKELRLSWCTGLYLLPEGLSDLSCLENLCLSLCSSLNSLPKRISGLRSLQNLDLSGCNSLAALPEDIGGLGKLKELRLSGCSDLTSIPDGISALRSLEELYVSGCDGLSTLPIVDCKVIGWPKN